MNIDLYLDGKTHFSRAMSVYEKKHFAFLTSGTGTLKEIPNEQKCAFNHILAAAEDGCEPAIALLLTDLFVNARYVELSENALNYMLLFNIKNMKTSKGFLYFLLGDLYNAINTDQKEKIPLGVIQNYYRKSMQNGCILGKIRFASIQYRQNFFSVCLKHNLEVLEHPHFSFLSNEWKSIVYNDISLCFYYQNEKKNFWKYNKKARELGLPVAKNNAANGYFRGYHKRQNYIKALRLYLEALADKNFTDKGGWAASQVKLLKEKC